MRLGSMNRLRVMILGARNVGKSAVTVRFLTRRFIGEYNSDIDLIYRSTVRSEDSLTEVEILDLCTLKGDTTWPAEAQLSWAEAFVIVYNICDRKSFLKARQLVEAVRKSPTYTPVLLMGNMKDLDHRRVVGLAEGRQVALEYSCQFYEVSAADNYVTITSAFQALIREARITQHHKTTSLKRRKSSLISVSKKLGAMFGKIHKDSEHEKQRGSV